MFDHITDSNWEKFEKEFPGACASLRELDVLGEIELLEYLDKHYSTMTLLQKERLASLRYAVAKFLPEVDKINRDFWVCLLHDQKEDRDYYWMHSAATCESDCTAIYEQVGVLNPHWAKYHTFVRVVPIRIDSLG